MALKIKDLMHPITVLPHTASVAEAAQVMDQKNIGSVLVEEMGEILGIFTERDLLRRIVAKDKNPKVVLLREVMSAPLITVDGETDVAEAAKLIETQKIRRLPVTEKGKIIGIASARGISRALPYHFIQKERGDYDRVIP